jgi:hypothetical protein
MVPELTLNLFKLVVSLNQSLSTGLSEEMVLLTPAEINKFISELRIKYGTKQRKAKIRVK